MRALKIKEEKIFENILHQNSGTKKGPLLKNLFYFMDKKSQRNQNFLKIRQNLF